MISYEVEFPTQKSVSLKIDGLNASGFPKTMVTDAIGGDVKVQLDKKTMLTVPYREDITADFTLEGYKQRAEHHAEAVVSKLVEAAKQQAAYDSNADSIVENARKNLNLCT
ncbi:hypothetical protein [Enterobacter hormaechei]|uniref:hypothetical protein n=1 Tax=Enterobacter hormaechei TaxID=158836 RepID=UPI003351EB99